MSIPVPTMHNVVRVTPDISEFEIRFEQLNIAARDVARLLIREDDPASPMVETVDEILREASQHIVPRVGYRVFNETNVNIQPDRISLGQTHFRTGKLVSERILEAGAMAAYVVSPGADVAHWEGQLSGQHEYLKASIVHALEMIVVERSADWLEDRMRETYRRSGLGLTNRFDLGFCGWNPEDAPVVLSLFPEGFCEVKTGPGHRMQPRASIAGLIGIGFNAVRREHPCYRCMDNIACVRRRT